MKSVRDLQQSMHRIKVGLIGLGAVLLLIAFASVVIGSASREAPVKTIGAPQPEVIANMALDNGANPANEPLAELGVATSTSTNAQASESVR
jgi:hypothetical protein